MSSNDYVMFIHGVKNHAEQEFLASAVTLSKQINKRIENIDLKPIYFFWGDLAVPLEDKLKLGMNNSKMFSNMWFQNIRKDTIIPFVGDAALYLSRHVGVKILFRLRDHLKSIAPQVGGRIHIVAHSLGSIILFDILFSGRWNDATLSSHGDNEENIGEVITEIRDAFYGMGKHKSQGFEIASIYTMGSPIALFSLISATGDSSHNLAPNLNALLVNLFNKNNTKLKWCNFVHPGDAIAYPLEGLLSDLLDKQQNGLDSISLTDIITDNGNIFSLPFQQTFFALLGAGDAHGSYWRSNLVASRIAKEIGQIISSPSQPTS